ncbi:MAG: rod shape-determining protein MreD [Candidatus Accumulibacter sp.]|jgi:rod shape-determining protein MreD|nr:rod shape-determining protein MreD [Accumulibacter sp.]
MSLTPPSSRILSPVRPGVILFSLLIMFLLNLMFSGVRRWSLDWVALALIFWSIREPHYIGMGAAFILGTLMDVAGASLMGQHAMAYVLASYAASAFSRRILRFSLKWQAIQILPLLQIVPLIQFCIRFAFGADFPGFDYFIGPFIGAALWRPLAYILLWPQYQPVERDENRPV